MSQEIMPGHPDYNEFNLAEQSRLDALQDFADSSFMDYLVKEVKDWRETAIKWANRRVSLEWAIDNLGAELAQNPRDMVSNGFVIQRLLNLRARAVEIEYAHKKPKRIFDMVDDDKSEVK